MQLPRPYSFQERLHGAGEGECIRATDADGNDVVLKTPIGLEADWANTRSAADAVKRFEAAKKREQAAAAAIPEHFFSGQMKTEGEQLFWVRPHWPRSLRDWVAFKETPSSKQLSAICLAIVRALGALTRMDGGGHGNLSLSNVLLGGKNRMAVRLVDLRDASTAEPKADKRALGLILYQLARSEFVEMDRSLNSVSAEEDWSGIFGKSGHEWRELCGDLLNPGSSLADADWAALEERILRIDRGGAGQGKWLVLAVLILGSSGAGLFFFWSEKEEAVTVDRSTLNAQWDYVLDEYFGWAAAFLASRRDFERERGSGAEAFVERFAPEGAFTAGKLAGLLGRVVPEARALFRSDPAEAERLARQVMVLDLNDADQEDIVRAERFLRELRDAIEGWPVVAELRKSRDRFAADGFEFGVERMNRLLAAVDLSEPGIRYQDLYELRQSAAGVDDLQAAYQRFRSAMEAIKSIEGTRFGREYAESVREGLASVTAEALGYLKEEAEQARRIENAWENVSDHLSKRLFGVAEAGFLETADLRRPGVVDEWVALLRAHREMDRSAMESEFERLRGQVRPLLEDLRETEKQMEAEAEAPALARRFQDVIANYQVSLPANWIEDERPAAVEAISRAETELTRLIDDIERRLDELKIDIQTELAELRADEPPTETPVLSERWRTFQREQLEGTTDESFASDREFLEFRRDYRAQRERLRRFETGALSEFRQMRTPEWETVSGEFRDVGMEIWERLFSARETAFLALAADFLFEDEDPSTRIGMEREKAEAALRQKSDELEAYLIEVEEALARHRRWELPTDGLVAWLENLNRTALRSAWSSETGMRRLLAPLFQAAAVQTDTPESLPDLVVAEEGDAFVRYLALDRIVEEGETGMFELNRWQNLVETIGPQIPESRMDEWVLLRKNLWRRIYAGARTPDHRARIIRAADAFGVVAADLEGSQRFAFELASAIDLLESRASLYQERPQMLEEVMNTLRTLPEGAGGAADVEILLQQLRNVDLDAEAAPMEQFPPVLQGWQILEEEEERMALEWSGHRLTFHRVDGAAGAFYVAETEMSIALFMDWMSEENRWAEMSSKVPGEWSDFVDNSYDPGPGGDFRRGPRIWNPGRSGLRRSGVRKPAAWFGGFDSFYEEKFSQQGGDILAPPSALDFNLPMQHTGAELARGIAESMGMRLPSPDEWDQVVGKADTPNPLQVWNSAWSERMESGLLNEMRMDSFYAAYDIPASGSGGARPPLFHPTDQGASRLKHLAGNVAEFGYDSGAGRYFVAGGSALAEVAGTWATRHRLAEADQDFPYSDVGLRLYFDAPLASPHAQFLDILRKAWQKLWNSDEN